jgi:hypothetical protein
MSRRWLSVVLLASACGAPPQAGTPADSSAAADPAPVPADSLVLQVPGGVEVWFTDARQATSPDGAPCLERALEVRAGGTSRGVPLLYTREAPTLLGGDAMRAVLYNNCLAGAAYRVDFATISPKRLTP